jgi:hypothetical protein
VESRDGWGLVQVRKVIADRSRLAPIARLLGAKVVSVEEGRSTVFLEASLRDLHGTVYARASFVGAIRRVKA